MDKVIIKTAKHINDLDESDMKYILEFVSSNIDVEVNEESYYQEYIEERYADELNLDYEYGDVRYHELEDYPELEEHFRATLIDNLKSRLGDRFSIFRMMTIDDQIIKNLEQGNPHLGIYWTWDVSVAESHWGKADMPYEILMTAEIDNTSVDWIDTIALNTNRILGDMEREIRLFKGTPIQITNIEFRRNKQTDIDPIIFQKTYYA